MFYQSLVAVLMPDVLRPIPLALTHSIRNFAKNLEGWAATTMAELPQEAYRVKMQTVRSMMLLLLLLLQLLMVETLTVEHRSLLLTAEDGEIAVVVVDGENS